MDLAEARANGPPGQRGEGRLARVAEPLAIFAVSRLALLFVAQIGRQLLGGPAAAGQPLFAWTNWDAWWYISIATGGYQPSLTQQSNVAFFPLYPLLIRALRPVLPNPFLAGLLVSYLSLAVALVILYDLIARQVDQDVARRSLLLLVAFPYALFYSAIYTEALFLALAALTFWLAERERWWLAGLAGALCAATRLIGVVLAPSLGLLYLQRRGYRPRALRREALACGLVPLGLLAFCLYLWLAYGDPLLAIRSAASWGVISPWQEGFGRLDPTRYLPGDDNLVLLLNFVVGLAWLILALPVARHLGPGYGLFVLLGALIPLVDKVDSLGRYVSVLFPAFVVLAQSLRPRYLFSLALGGSAMLLAVLTVLYTTGHRVF